MEKLKLGVIFGGMSTEHNVSVVSATSIIESLNKDKYEIFPIYINENGNWYRYTKEVNKIKILELGESLNKEIEEITSKPLNEKLVLEYLKDGDNSCAEKNIVIFEKRRILVRAITDYIAGMTDHFAIEQYTEIFIPKFFMQK